MHGPHPTTTSWQLRISHRLRRKKRPSRLGNTWFGQNVLCGWTLSRLKSLLEISNYPGQTAFRRYASHGNAQMWTRVGSRYLTWGKSKDIIGLSHRKRFKCGRPLDNISSIIIMLGLCERCLKGSTMEITFVLADTILFLIYWGSDTEHKGQGFDFCIKPSYWDPKKRGFCWVEKFNLLLK